MLKEEFSQMLKQIIGENPDSETLTVSGLYNLVEGYDLFEKEDVLPDEAPEVGEDGVAKTGEIVNLTSETIQAWTDKFDDLETTIQDIYSRLSSLEGLVSAVDDVEVITVPTTEIW